MSNPADVLNEQSLKLFLSSVKGTDKFVQKAFDALAKNDINELAEMKCAKVAVIKEHIGAMSGGLEAFLDEAIQKYQASLVIGGGTKLVADNASQGVIGGGMAERLGAVEAHLGTKPAEPEVHVDISKKVGTLALTGLPRTSWPMTEKVDKLATEVAKTAKKLKVEKPFVYVELEKHLPSWCTSSVAENGNTGILTKKMDIARWSIAFDKYALAAACIGQMTLAQAMVHKEMCMKVAMAAGAGETKRNRMLGVFYDEVCRRSWAEASVCGDIEFNFDAEVMAMSEVHLKSAKNMYDEADKVKTPVKGYGGELTCFSCGQKGHKSTDCPSGGSKGAGKFGKSAGKSAKGNGKSAAVVCHYCGVEGHKSYECTQNPANALKRKRYNEGA